MQGSQHGPVKVSETCGQQRSSSILASLASSVSRMTDGNHAHNCCCTPNDAVALRALCLACTCNSDRDALSSTDEDIKEYDLGTPVAFIHIGFLNTHMYIDMHVQISTDMHVHVHKYSI